MADPNIAQDLSSLFSPADPKPWCLAVLTVALFDDIGVMGHLTAARGANRELMTRLNTTP